MKRLIDLGGSASAAFMSKGQLKALMYGLSQCLKMELVTSGDER